MQVLQLICALFTVLQKLILESALSSCLQGDERAIYEWALQLVQSAQFMKLFDCMFDLLFDEYCVLVDE